MRLLVSGATKTVKELSAKNADFLGVLVVPHARNTVDAVCSLGLPIAADNGAFSGLDKDAFMTLLKQYSRVNLRWVACPDVVCNASETIRMWAEWSPVIQEHGFRPCLVLQDGMTMQDIFKIDPDAIFVGGSTDFKFSKFVRNAVEWAKTLGRHAHMGRVNTLKRMRYAFSIGCDSVDGSGFSKWPKRIELGVRWLRELHQPVLFN